MKACPVHRICKKGRNVLCSFLICVLLFSCSSSTEDNKPAGTSITNNISSVRIASDGSSIRITNDGSSEIGFNVVINGKPFYASVDEIISDINNLPSEYANEPLYRKLWRYLIGNRYHFEPYTETIWQHSPVLFLNSIGFGYCDDAASLYYALATRLGYTARVWNMVSSDFSTGHVVAEIWIQDHWEIYDSDMEVYYWNDQGQVAGAEELAVNPQWITNPTNPFPLSHFTWSALDPDNAGSPYAYEEETADIYSRKDSNQIAPAYYQQVALPKYDHPFSLPPKAYLEFPAQMDRPLRSSYDTDVPLYEIMRLVLPKNWSGSVKLPFVMIAINGSGSISLNNTVYDVGSAAISDLLNERSTYIYQASVINALTEIEILFLVNKTRFDLHNISSIVLK